MNTVPLCECPAAGFCARYKRNMHARAHGICSGAMLSPDKQAVYRANWLRMSQAEATEPVVRPPGRPGTELKKLLAWWGLKTDGCGGKCNQRAAEMDRRGPDWCEANIETIVDWLRESAAERGLPFVRAAGRRMVRKAIKLARAKAASSGS